jgi:hypothetical protein
MSCCQESAEKLINTQAFLGDLVSLGKSDIS